MIAVQNARSMIARETENKCDHMILYARPTKTSSTAPQSASPRASRISPKTVLQTVILRVRVVRFFVARVLLNWTLRPRTRTRRADAHALARRCADDARHAAMFSGKNAADGKVRPAGRAHRARSIAFSDAVTSPRSATSSASSSSSFRRRFLLPLVQKGRLVRRSTRAATPPTLTVSRVSPSLRAFERSPWTRRIC